MKDNNYLDKAFLEQAGSFASSPQLEEKPHYDCELCDVHSNCAEHTDEPEEWESRFHKMWNILDFEVCMRDKSMNTQTLDDYEQAEPDDIISFLKTEIRKAEESKNDDIQKVINRYKDSYPRPAGIIEALEALKK